MTTATFHHAWQRAFHLGILPRLGIRGAAALEAAMARKDPALIQEHTTIPPCMDVTRDMRPCQVCGVSYALWKSRDLTTVQQVEDAFAKLSREVDDDLGETGAFGYFTRYWDDELPDRLYQKVGEEIAAYLDAQNPDEVLKAREWAQTLATSERDGPPYDDDDDDDDQDQDEEEE